MSDEEERKLRLFEILVPIAVLVGALGLGLVGWDLRSEAKERERVIGWLNNLSGTYSVKIDGREVAEPTEIVSALKTIAHVPAHHSSPAQPLLFKVEAHSESLELFVGRDSQQPMEYWVFVPDKGNRAPRELGKEIGRITTAGFTSYWGSTDK